MSRYGSILEIMLACISEEVPEGQLEDGAGHPVFDRKEIFQDLVPAMLKVARPIAEQQFTRIKSEAAIHVEESSGHEIQRLEALRQINDHISESI